MKITWVEKVKRMPPRMREVVVGDMDTWRSNTIARHLVIRADGASGYLETFPMKVQAQIAYCEVMKQYRKDAK